MTRAVQLFADDLRSRVQGAVKVQEPLGRHTSFRIGGPCDVWVEPQSVEDLSAAVRMVRQAGVPLFIIGAGSNLLVRDRGFPGVVVSLRGPAFQQVAIEDSTIRAGAGVSLYQLVQVAQRAELAGCEFLTGIPATVGGAVAMNAGTSREWISQILDRLTCLTPGGELVRHQRDELTFAYRTSPVRGELVLDAELRLQPGAPEEIARRIRRYLDYKNATQETTTACAGCIFQNPPGHSAGRLIEQAGLKGRRIGDAMVSLKHANFIVNVNRATYADVAHLIDLIRNTVRAEFGVWLELEVKVV